MESSTAYSLQELPRHSPGAGFRSRLVADAVPLDTVVDGTDIDLQLRCGPFTVLATSYDYFEGCEHWISLLCGAELVEQVQMPDTLGFLQDPTVLGPFEVEFGYFGCHDRWNLQVLEKGFWSFVPDAVRTRPGRFWFRRRYLMIRRRDGRP